MADIEVVIKMDEKYFDSIKVFAKTGNNFSPWKEIANGVQLPKGHGRLVDANEVDDNIYDLTRGMDLDYNQISDVLGNAQTILRADDESEE